MNPIIENYLHRVADVLLSPGAESLEDLVFRSEGYEVARLIMVARFPGGFRLSVHARVAIQDGWPDLWRYSMHFMDSDNATIFRYDNSPHFHAGEIDHKHEGERAFICPRPSIRQIRNEIADHLNANPQHR